MISYNPCRIHILLFLSYSFGTETTNTFIHTRSSLENHTLFQIKRAKWTPAFRPIRCKNHTLWGGAYLYGSQWRVQGRGPDAPPLFLTKLRPDGPNKSCFETASRYLGVWITVPPFLKFWIRHWDYPRELYSQVGGATHPAFFIALVTFPMASSTISTIAA